MGTHELWEQAKVLLGKNVNNTALAIHLVIVNKLLEQCKGQICFIFLSSKKEKLEWGGSDFGLWQI